MEPKHYKKALKEFSKPEFLNKDILIHDYKESTFNGYKVDSYADSLVKNLNGLNDIYYARILTDELKNSEDISFNKRYSVIKFFQIKDSIIESIKKELKKSVIKELEYLKKKKSKKEYTLPLSFDGKSFLLVNYKANYADEFDVYGFRVFDTIEWEQWKSNLEDGCEYCFGTNESIYYHDKQSILNDFKIIQLSVEEVKILYKLFGAKQTEYLDFNGKDHNEIIHYTVCSHGVFPYNLGVKEEED